MKNFTHVLKKAAVDFWNDEEAQGMIEYILMMVAVVGIATFLGPKIMDIVKGKTQTLESSVTGFSVGD